MKFSPVEGEIYLGGGETLGCLPAPQMMGSMAVEETVLQSFQCQLKKSFKFEMPREFSRRHRDWGTVLVVKV
jgi:hypothetical protein